MFRQGVYEVYISDIVLREIDQCTEEKLRVLLNYMKQIKYHVIETNKDIVELAGKFIDFGILREKSFDDCQHIAVAILAGCDVIISWNFKLKTVKGVKIITTMEGYKDLLIYQPSALFRRR